MELMDTEMNGEYAQRKLDYNKKRMKQISDAQDALIRGMHTWIPREHLEDAVEDMITMGEIKPTIGFFKECRKQGINIHTICRNNDRHFIRMEQMYGDR